MAFGYAPGFGAYQPLQNGFNQFPTNFPAMQQNAPQPPTAAPRQGFTCIPVTCREQVVATQIPFDGSTTFFVDTAAGMIYAKTFDLNTGAAPIQEYVRVEHTQVQPEFVPMGMFKELLAKVEQLEKGVTVNVSDGPNE